MSLRNALALFFGGLILAATADLWYSRPREHVVLIVIQVLAGAAMIVWASWKAPKPWKRRGPPPKTWDDVAA